MKYDYLIVGAGFFGATFAHEMKKIGKKVLVIDKRDHIGGNAYTKNVEGINVHVYGPHIFHTNNKKIWDYVNQFATFNHFVNRVKVRFGDKVYSMPINLMTFNQVAGCITPKDAQEYLEKECKTYKNPKNLEEWMVSQVGWPMYNLLIRGYTKKQWKRDPKELPASIIKRLPIRMTYDDNYYNDCYQGIPMGGYTQIFEKMLDGIEVKLQTDDYKNWEKIAHKLVYTGRIDEFFGYIHGDLQYRTLEFKHRIVEAQDFQGVAQMNYSDESVPYTRIIEHKHFEFGLQPKTVITYEYPTEWNINKTPYYPINDDANNAIYKKYKEMGKIPNIIWGGRLAEFKYYDMHQVIASALTHAEKEK